METIALILFLCLIGLKPFKAAFGEVTNLIRSVVALTATAGEVAPLRGGFVVAARAGQAGSLPSQSGAECSIKNRPQWGVFPPFLSCFASFGHISFMLKAMSKKAKCIVALSFPKCLKRRYAMLNFICPRAASGSMQRHPLCLIPSSKST